MNANQQIENIMTWLVLIINEYNNKIKIVKNVTKKQITSYQINKTMTTGNGFLTTN